MRDPSAHIITRDLRFDVDRHARHGWLAGDILHSILIDCMAVMLPAGERFFIRSLRHYEARMPDAFVRLGIQGYAAQEAFHTREHEAYNRGMRALGYDPEGLTEKLRRVLPPADKPFKSLLVTCALEHITYGMSCNVLSDPKLMAKADEAYRRLWTWHALEEVEHANVALAVLAEAGRNMPGWKVYAARVIAMVQTLRILSRESIRNANAMQRAAGIKPGWRSWSRIMWLAWVGPGWVRRYVPHLLAYFRPGYGRGNARDAKLIATGRMRLAESLGRQQQAA